MNTHKINIIEIIDAMLKENTEVSQEACEKIAKSNGYIPHALAIDTRKDQ